MVKDLLVTNNCAALIFNHRKRPKGKSASLQ